MDPFWERPDGTGAPHDTSAARGATRRALGGAGGGVLALADGQLLPLTGDEVNVGRAASNDVAIDEPTIAAHHARLQRAGGSWVLTALGNGARTEVNGQRLTRPVVLAPGDAVRLGRLDLEFRPNGLTSQREQPTAAWMDAAAGRAQLRAGWPMIELHDVAKTYPTSAGPLMVLRDVRLAVQPGEFVAIVGPSGCGKSTLLNLIAGIDRPDAGAVVVGGQLIHRLGDDALTGWRGRNVGIVFQFFQLLPTLTVAENVMLPMAFCGTYAGAARRARAIAVLRRVGMDHLADRLPSVLSGGEQQRVAIARALANAPPVMVADEPTGNLDARTGRQVFALFAGLAAAGTTVLMVTHDTGLAGEAPRRVEMLDGRIVGAA